MSEGVLYEIRKGMVCNSCERVYAEGDDPAPPLRECSNDNCNEQFVSEERACPSCNRTFTRKLAEHGCEDCNEELEEGERFFCTQCDEHFEDEEKVGEHFHEQHGGELLEAFQTADAESTAHGATIKAAREAGAVLLPRLNRILTTDAKVGSFIEAARAVLKVLGVTDEYVEAQEKKRQNEEMAAQSFFSAAVVKGKRKKRPPSPVAAPEQAGGTQGTKEAPATQGKAPETAP